MSSIISSKFKIALVNSISKLKEENNTNCPKFSGSWWRCGHPPVWNSAPHDYFESHSPSQRNYFNFMQIEASTFFMQIPSSRLCSLCCYQWWVRLVKIIKLLQSPPINTLFRRLRSPPENVTHSGFSKSCPPYMQNSNCRLFSYSIAIQTHSISSIF